MTRFLLATALSLVLALPATAEEGGSLRRFALVVGTNNGGTQRVVLSFARTDAESFSRVLNRLGGVPQADSTLLLDPRAESLRAAFSAVAASVKAARDKGQRTEVVFYFSGHSDEQGLLLFGERMTYKEVREALDAVPADVRIAILDSCASGALTRLKGGTWRAPFQVDASTKVTGRAFLTSSSASEAAQESDAIGGSFFTHYMVSGLRGAADVSRDGKVTLNEAYQYAFSETLHRTEATRGGAQHPSYDFQLSGSGDVVLTDLRSTTASLVIPADMDGRLFIRDGSSRLVAEVNKLPGSALTIGLEPGQYSVTWQRRAEYRRGTLALADGQSATLDPAKLEPVEGELTALRGEPAVIGGDSGAPGSIVPFSFGIVPGLSTNGGHEAPVKNYVSVNLLGERGNMLSGVEASSIFAIRTHNVEGVQASGIFNIGESDINGAQAAGIFNIASEDLGGLQWSGVFNHASGQVVGGQATAIVNVAVGDVTGVQGAAIGNVANGNLTGVQATAVAGIVKGDLSGVQATAVLGLTRGSVEGVQFAGVANIAAEGVSGAQAGVFNFSGDEVEGAQIGVINIAKNSDFSLGLINVMWDGRTHLDVWGNEGGFTNLTLKHGGDYWHSLYTVGYQPGFGEQALSVSLGLGGHLPLTEEIFIDGDLLYGSIKDRDMDWSDLEGANSVATLRLVMGYRVLDWLSVFAGASANVLITAQPDPGRYAPLGSVNLYDGGGDQVELWPGFVAGVELL